MAKMLFISQDSERSIDQVIVVIGDDEKPQEVLCSLRDELDMENPYIESVLEVEPAPGFYSLPAQHRLYYG